MAVAGVGCSAAPATTGTNGSGNDTGTRRGTDTTAATPHDQAVRFAACMCENDVADFPDPDASGRLNYDGVVSCVVGVDGLEPPTSSL